MWDLLRSNQEEEEVPTYQRQLAWSGNAPGKTRTVGQRPSSSTRLAASLCTDRPRPWRSSVLAQREAGDRHRPPCEEAVPLPAAVVVRVLVDEREEVGEGVPPAVPRVAFVEIGGPVIIKKVLRLLTRRGGGGSNCFYRTN